MCAALKLFSQYAPGKQMGGFSAQTHNLRGRQSARIFNLTASKNDDQATAGHSVLNLLAKHTYLQICTHAHENMICLSDRHMKEFKADMNLPYHMSHTSHRNQGRQRAFLTKKFCLQIKYPVLWQTCWNRQCTPQLYIDMTDDFQWNVSQRLPLKERALGKSCLHKISKF